MPTTTATRCQLIVEDRLIPLSSRYTIRFVEQSDGTPKPVLYRDGRRLIEPWSLELSHREPPDPHGCSG